MSRQRNTFVTLLAVAGILTVGTAYSVINNTYLDTSNPLLAHLPHPSHHFSYFARKSNVFNQVFVKQAWGWTSALFFALWITSPPQTRSMQRLGRWFTATLVWVVFTTWFFGPAVIQRLITASGGECIISLPPSDDGSAPELLAVPPEYCHTKSTITAATHPFLFTSSVILPPGWNAKPKLYRGHDLSGHVFLLTLSVLFLVDQVKATSSRRLRISPEHIVAKYATYALIALWFWMLLMTGVYFHTPMEKFTGFLVGVCGFAFTQIVSPDRTPPVGTPLQTKKLRADVPVVHYD